MAYLANHGDIWYSSIGTGEPIILLPGLGFSGYHWQRQLTLADYYQVISFDPRGQGSSATNNGPWTLRQIAADVRTLILELDLHNVTLVGWSMSSFVIFEYIHHYGNDRLKAICSVDMTPRNTLEPTWQHAIFGDLTMGTVVDNAGAIIDDYEAWLRALSGASFAADTVADEETVTAWTADAIRTSPGALLAYWLDLARSDWRDFVATITVPTLLCHGSKSQAVPTDVGEWLHKTIPNSQLIKFNESGHVPFWEQADKFNESLATFVATC